MLFPEEWGCLTSQTAVSNGMETWKYPFITERGIEPAPTHSGELGCFMTLLTSTAETGDALKREK
jgi:hypothetical protein